MRVTPARCSTRATSGSAHADRHEARAVPAPVSRAGGGTVYLTPADERG
jgi:hypothetical protein